jgi:hypothetical protein
MKGHFFPRKSKLVFLNNSIEPATAGLEFQTPACIQKFPPIPNSNIRNLQNDSGYHKPEPVKESAQNGARRDQFLIPPGGARRTLCALDESSNPFKY